MTAFVTAIHVVVCVLLILSVLMQAGKGGGISGLVGGAGQAVLGAGAAGNFLTRLTSGLAIAFFLTTLTLSFMNSHDSSASLKARAEAAAANAPAEAPAEAPAAPTGDTAAAPAAPAGDAPPAAAPAPAGDTGGEFKLNPPTMNPPPAQ